MIEQFLSGYIADPKISNRYLLISTSDTSKNIKYDLKKIFDSIRLNDTGFKENPLNTREKKTFSTLSTVFNRLFEKLTSKKPSDDDLINFCKQVFVTIIDVETGMTTEKIAIMLLHIGGFNLPSLVWNYLVSQSLYFASNRLSLNFNGVNEILEKFLSHKGTAAELELQLNELLKPVTLNESKLSTGKDVFIVESFVEDFDLAIVELFRFDDKGQKRVKFEDDCVLLTQGKTKAKVVRRFATTVGLQRYVEENKSYFADKKVAILETKDISNVEESAAAIKHREFCHELIKKNTTFINCLHSNKSCFSSPSYLVEVDYPNYPPAIGMVREEFLKPLDRILGKPIVPEGNSFIPTEINVTEWVSLLQKGQGFSKSIPTFQRAAENKVMVVGWNEKNQTYSEYNYCIRNNLQDGSSNYVYARGKIQCFPKYRAEQEAANINSHIEELKASGGEPMCMSSENWAIGPRSLVEKMKEEGEEVLEIVSVDVCNYSKLLGDLHWCPNV